MSCITEPNRIKIKLLEGDTFQCNLMEDASNPETYVKWLFIFIRVISKKKFDKKLKACSKSLKKVLEDLRKTTKVPKKESPEQKAEQELELTAAKLRSAEAHAKHATAISVCYDLFCQLLADEPQVQWDRIVMEVHNKDPWTGLDGNKHKGLHMKTEDLQVA
jgi:hypothetical protein